MRVTRLAAVGIVGLLVWPAAAADKGPPKGEASNSKLKIEATLHMDKDDVDKVVGEKMEDNFFVVEVTLTPASGEKLDVYLDDFLLRSDKDGQKGKPYYPSQIAGASVMTVSTVYSGGAVGSDPTGPVWGPAGGGPPSRLPIPSSSGSGIGNTSTHEDAEAKIESGKEVKASPLMQALQKHVLPEKQIDAPLSGQLYFLMEGKHKVKQIELYYHGKAGKLSVRFKED